MTLIGTFCATCTVTGCPCFIVLLSTLTWGLRKRYVFVPTNEIVEELCIREELCFSLFSFCFPRKISCHK